MVKGLLTRKILYLGAASVHDVKHRRHRCMLNSIMVVTVCYIGQRRHDQMLIVVQTQCVTCPYNSVPLAHADPVGFGRGQSCALLTIGMMRICRVDRLSLLRLLTLLFSDQTKHFLLRHPRSHALHNPVQRAAASHHVIEVPHIEPTTMVTDALLSPIVRSYLVLAPSLPCTSSAAQPSEFLFSHFAPLLSQARPHESPRLLAILELRSRVLHGNDGIGRQMRKPNSGLRAVHMLPACAAGTHDVDLDVFGIDVVVTLRVVEAFFSHFCTAFSGYRRQYKHTGSRCVGSTFAFCSRDTLNAMYARLAAEHTVRSGRIDFNDRFLHVAT